MAKRAVFLVMPLAAIAAIAVALFGEVSTFNAVVLYSLFGQTLLLGAMIAPTFLLKSKKKGPPAAPLKR